MPFAHAMPEDFQGAVETRVDVDLLELRLIHIGVLLHGQHQIGDAAGGGFQFRAELIGGQIGFDPGQRGGQSVRA